MTQVLILEASRNHHINDKDTLVRLATDVGLDRNAVTTVLSGDMFKKEVEADERAARQMGVSGVPFFLVDDLIPINGGQSPERVLASLNQAWAAREAQPMSAASIR